jgi:hypothetical protein
MVRKADSEWREEDYELEAFPVKRFFRPSLPVPRGRWKFRQLFLNGKRQIRARYPKFDPNNPLYGGWLFIEGPAEERSQNSVVYRPGTFQRRWAKPTEAEVVFFPGAGWNDTTASIKTMDDSRRVITLARDIRNQDRPPWFSPFPLLEWRKLGYDSDSQIADPLFVDPMHDDYRLKPESPAFRLGFIRIDMAKIGMRHQRAREAIQQRIEGY